MEYGLMKVREGGGAYLPYVNCVDIEAENCPSKVGNSTIDIHLIAIHVVM